MKKTLIHSIIRALRINNRKACHIFHARFHTQRKDTIFCRIKTAFICTPSMHVKAVKSPVQYRTLYHNIFFGSRPHAKSFLYTSFNRNRYIAVSA